MKYPTTIPEMEAILGKMVELQKALKKGAKGAASTSKASLEALKDVLSDYVSELKVAIKKQQEADVALNHALQLNRTFGDMARTYGHEDPNLAQVVRLLEELAIS